MDVSKIKKLIELGQNTGIAEIEIGDKNESVHITYKSYQTASDLIVEAYPEQAHPTHLPSDAHDQPVAEASKKEYTFKSPLVGRIHLSPSQGEQPFVEVGKKIKTGDVLCLIQSMRMNHQITADKDGIIAEILIKSESPAEFDQPLFKIHL